MVWAEADESNVTFSRSFVNCSLVLPGYFWIVMRSSSNWSSGASSIGRSNSPCRSNSAYAADALDR